MASFWQQGYWKIRGRLTLKEARTEDNDKTELKNDFSISHTLYNWLTLWIIEQGAVQPMNELLQLQLWSIHQEEGDRRKSTYGREAVTQNHVWVSAFEFFNWLEGFCGQNQSIIYLWGLNRMKCLFKLRFLRIKSFGRFESFKNV